MNTCGKIRAKIDIEIRASAQNSLGEIVDSWSVVLQPWASIKTIKPASSRAEDQSAAQQHAEIVTEFTIRYTSSAVVNSSNRLHYDGTYYDILSVIKLPDVRTRELLIVAKVRND